MNCSKCHAPINEGDKFCQTCGSLVPQVTNAQQEVQPEVNNEVTNIENSNVEVVNTTPVNEQPVNNFNVEPVVENQPMNNQMNMTQPVGFNTQQPVMNNNMPMNTFNQAPVMNTAMPQDPKKNNTVVFILMGVVLVLLAFVVFLLIGSGKDDKEKENKNDDKTPVVEENNNNDNNDNNKVEDNNDVIASNYTKSNVNEYTFELPKGYSAGYYGNSVVFYDDEMTDVEGYLSSINGAYTTIDKEMTKANFQALGIENVTYLERKVNNKNMLIFEGSYQGYDVEVVYVEYSYTKIVAAEVYYKSYASVNSDVYDILGRVVVDDSAFSSNSNIRVPNLQLAPTTK